MSNDIKARVIAQGAQQEIVDLLAHVCEVTKMRFSAVARVTDSQWIACQVDDRIDFGLAPGDELELRMTICEDIRKSGKMVVIDSVDDHVDWQTHAVPAFYGFKSYASLPVYAANGSFYGTLCALDPEPKTVSSAIIVSELEACARRLTTLLG